MEDPKQPFSLTSSINSFFSAFTTPPEKESEIIGIEDIDATWVFATDDDYNSPMNTAFCKKHITKHWLCSDMKFDEDEMRTRALLEAHMTKQKYEVLGIITPSDYAWHIDCEILEKFYEACNAPEMDIDFKQKRNVHKLKEILERPEFEAIKNLIQGNVQGQVKPGTVYTLMKTCMNKPKLFEDFKKRARQSKWVVDTLCAVSDIPRPGLKGLILRPLLAHKTAENNTYVFFDDRKTEVDDVSHEYKFLPTIRISAFLCPSKKDEMYTEKYFNDCIQLHCEKFNVKNPTPKGSFLAGRRRASSNASSTSHPSSSASSPAITPPKSPRDTEKYSKEKDTLPKSQLKFGLTSSLPNLVEAEDNARKQKHASQNSNN